MVGQQLCDDWLTGLTVCSGWSPKHRGGPYHSAFPALSACTLVNSCQKVIFPTESLQEQPSETSILILTHDLLQSSKCGKLVATFRVIPEPVFRSALPLLEKGDQTPGYNICFLAPYIVVVKIREGQSNVSVVPLGYEWYWFLFRHSSL